VLSLELFVGFDWTSSYLFGPCYTFFYWRESSDTAWDHGVKGAHFSLAVCEALLKSEKDKLRTCFALKWTCRLALGGVDRPHFPSMRASIASSCGVVSTTEDGDRLPMNKPALYST
jgi:hypothetical protein